MAHAGRGQKPKWEVPIKEGQTKPYYFVKTQFRSMFTMLALPKTPAQSFRRGGSGSGCRCSFFRLDLTARFAAMLMLLAGLQPAAATSISSTVPANGAANVSPAAPVVFTFSAAMNPSATTATFIDETAGGESPPVITAWSSNNTVLTCTASPQFANNHLIEWSVSGLDAMGNALTGTTSGDFTTIVGVNGGSGTNAYTVSYVAEYWEYEQTNSAPPVLAKKPYVFDAQTALASNLSATSITVTLPTSAVSNLVEDALTPEKYDLNVGATNLATFNSDFPTGDYTFTINGSSPQQVAVDLPVFAQPNAPQITDYTAAQSINASQPFTVTWNTFTNGTSADLISFEVLGVFQTPDFGQPGALNGTNTSFTIPAGTLQPGTNYSAALGFYHYTLATNGTVITLAYVGSLTGVLYFKTATNSAPPLLTISQSGTNVILAWPTNAAGFNLEYATNLNSPSWNTNLPAPVVINTNNVVTNGISSTQRYYLLVNP
jgi:hypothetical protein